MKLLERYIAKSVFFSLVMVAFLLIGLQIFILFIQQAQDVGKAGYDIVVAAKYVFLRMPYEVYLFFPIVCLLGALVGLGLLANYSELIVMRASGMSILQISLAVFKIAVVIIFFVTILGETLIPKMAYYAADLKNQALYEGQTLRTRSGVWLRDHNDFVFIEKLSSKEHLGNVVQFHFDAHHQLQFARKMHSVDFDAGKWQATDIEETEFYPTHITSKRLDKMLWSMSISPSLFALSASEPNEMSLLELRQYLSDKKKNHQSASNYEFAYYLRLMQPFASIVMMLLGIPFVFGPLRSSSMGARLLLGSTAGFSFYILNRLFGFGAQVWQFSPAVAVPIPILLFALLGLYLMKRVR